MRPRVSVGTTVQTPFGKGVVLEVQNSGRLRVDVQGRLLILRDADVTVVAEGRRPSARREVPAPTSPEPTAHSFPPSPQPVPQEVDLHGLTVEDALSRAERILNDALLASHAELRFIHGRSGGRIRGALHRWLRELPSVASFRLDPRNPGVTIVRL